MARLDRDRLAGDFAVQQAQQATRVADRTAFLMLGRLVEYAPTMELFTTPRDPQTEAYVSGRFG